VADDGLDSRTTLHLAPDGSRDAADLPRDPDPEPVRVVCGRGTPLSTWMRRASTPVSFSMSAAERVPVEGIAVQRLGMEHELSALRVDVTGVAILTLQPNS